MTDKLAALLQEDSRQIANAWQGPLTDLAKRWQGRIVEWERVFPGLVGFVGIHCLLWPQWQRAVAKKLGASEPALAYRPHEGDDSQPTWQFYYRAVAPKVAWAAIRAPGLTPLAKVRAAMEHRDSMRTLATLDSKGQVVATGQASDELFPLIGHGIKGEGTLGLPICDCEQIAESLPDWQASVAPLAPLMAAAVERLHHWWREQGGADNWRETPDLAYALLAWQIWQELADLSCFQSCQAEKKSFFSKLFGPRTQTPFTGVLVLRGDHLGLWRKINPQPAARSPQ